MKIKQGDNVLVIAGNDKGKTGKVLKTLRKENRVIVEGVHVVKKHMKPGRMGEPGGIIEKEAPINASNVKVVEDAKTAKTKKVTKKEDKKEVKEEKPKRAATKKKTTKKESDK